MRAMPVATSCRHSPPASRRLNGRSQLLTHHPHSSDCDSADASPSLRRSSITALAPQWRFSPALPPPRRSALRPAFGSSRCSAFASPVSRWRGRRGVSRRSPYVDVAHGAEHGICFVAGGVWIAPRCASSRRSAGRDRLPARRAAAPWPPRASFARQRRADSHLRIPTAAAGAAALDRWKASAWC